MAVRNRLLAPVAAPAESLFTGTSGSFRVRRYSQRPVRDRAAAECDSTRQKEAPLLNKAESRPSAEHGARLRARVGRGMRSPRVAGRRRRKPKGIVDLGEANREANGPAGERGSRPPPPTPP